MEENLDKLSISAIEERAQYLYSRHEYEEALPCIQRLVALGRTEPQMRVYEAQSLYYNRRAPEAALILRGLMASDPDNTDYPLILSQYERAMGNFDESLKLLKNVPVKSPGFATLMGWHHMRLGNFAKGFEFFSKEPGIPALSKWLELPQEKIMPPGGDMRGRTVLYLLEGGFGDEVLFSRFAKTLEERGALVTVGASKRIAEILKHSLYVKEPQVIEGVNPAEYDYCLTSTAVVPALCITDPAEGFAFPYLFPEQSEIKKWEPVIEREAAGKKKIGIHWQGNWGFDAVEMKSPPACLMLKFAELGKLFSLQRDAGGNALPPGSPVFDTETAPPSWASTAAVISQMDYIITNDTSTAHLSGALGKKTLILLPHAPHFYWAKDMPQSVWYPTAYTFRQSAYNDWERAVAAARAWIKKEEQAS